MSSDTDWTEHLITQLTALWLRVPVLSAQEIASALHLSKNQVIGKVHRLRLPPRPSPVKPTQGVVSKRTVARRRQRQERKDAPVPPRLTVVVVTEAPRPDEPIENEGVRPTPATESVMAQSRDPTQRGLPPASFCCWPLWGFRGRPTHEYCCQAIEPKRRYCAVHNRIAFVSAPVRERAA